MSDNEIVQPDQPLKSPRHELAVQYLALGDAAAELARPNVRGWSGYPPKLSVKVNIPDGGPDFERRVHVKGPRARSR